MKRARPRSRPSTSRGRSRHALHLVSGRLHADLQLLPHGHAEARPQSRGHEIVGQFSWRCDRIGDWPGAQGRETVGSFGGRTQDHQRRADGHGRNALQFRQRARGDGHCFRRRGISLSKRRITFSTSGVVPEIAGGASFRERCSQFPSMPLRDELRDELVPINKKYPIAELMEACRTYQACPTPSASPSNT